MFTMTSMALRLLAAAAVAATATLAVLPVSLTIIVNITRMFTTTRAAVRSVASVITAVAATAPRAVLPGVMATPAVAGVRVILTVFPALRVVRGAGTVIVTRAMASAMAVTVARHVLAARVISAAAIVVLVIAIVPGLRGIFVVLGGEMVVLPGLTGFVGVGIVGEMAGSWAGGRGS